MVTDPPYEFEARGGGLYSDSDSMVKTIEAETDSFDFEGYIPELLRWMGRWNKDTINAYFCCNLALVNKYLNWAEKRDMTADILVMDRASAPPAHSSHYIAHLEYVMFLRRIGQSAKKPTFVGKSEGDDNALYRKVYNANPSEMNGNEHPNEKPINMMNNFIKVSSNIGDVVIDPFVGSGTTVKACQELGRFCVGIDKNAKWLEIAKTRLKQLSLGI
jgi:DNA modification methylase